MTSGNTTLIPTCGTSYIYHRLIRKGEKTTLRIVRLVRLATTATGKCSNAINVSTAVSVIKHQPVLPITLSSTVKHAKVAMGTDT